MSAATSYLEFWVMASRADIGVALNCVNRKSVASLLYIARTEYRKQHPGDDSLDGLSLTMSPVSPDEIWIIKQAAKQEYEDGSRTP